MEPLLTTHYSALPRLIIVPSNVLGPLGPIGLIISNIIIHKKGDEVLVLTSTYFVFHKDIKQNN